MKDAYSVPAIKRYGFRRVGSHITAIGWILFRYALLMGLSFIILYPLLYMLTMAFRPAEQIYDPSVIWVPKSFTMENIKTAWELMEYEKTLVTTLCVNIVSSLLQVISCAVTGYGFARFQFKGKNLCFMLVVMMVLVPSQITAMPMFLTFKSLGMLNSYLTFYIPAILGAGIKSGLFIFIFRQFFRGLPKELEDAAAIDGCGFVGCFLRIVIPNAVTVFIMASLLSVMWYWNDTFTSSMFLTNMKTVTIALSGLSSQATLITGGATADPFQIITMMQAGSLLCILPLLLLYLLLQRYFVQGVERSGIVG